MADPKRIVIGYVHGHYDALIQLLEMIAPDKQDGVYFVGDLIDRGPDSARVVDFVMKHGYHCLLGNHEQMMLEAVGSGDILPQYLQSWLYSGGYPTLESYNHQIPQDHINWLKQRPLYLDIGDTWLVHAGVDPKLPITQQGEDQFCWIRDDFHQHPDPYFEDKLIITGHTITFTFPKTEPGKLVSGPGWLDIDTGAYHPKSGWLTAIELNTKEVFQVNTMEGKFRRLPFHKAVVKVAPGQIGGSRRKRKKSWFS